MYRVARPRDAPGSKRRPPTRCQEFPQPAGIPDVDALAAPLDLDLRQKPVESPEETGADQRVLEQEARVPTSPAAPGGFHAHP